MVDVFSSDAFNQQLQPQMHPIQCQQLQPQYVQVPQVMMEGGEQPVQMQFVKAPEEQSPTVGSPPAGPNVQQLAPGAVLPGGVQLERTMSNMSNASIQSNPQQMMMQMQPQMIQLPNGQIVMQPQMMPMVGPNGQMLQMQAPNGQMMQMQAPNGQMLQSPNGQLMPQMQIPGGQMFPIQQMNGQQQMFYPMMQQQMQPQFVPVMIQNTPQGSTFAPVYYMSQSSLQAQQQGVGGHPPSDSPYRMKMSRSHSNTSFDGSDWSESLELSSKLSLHRFHSSISSSGSDGYGSDFEPPKRHRHSRVRSRHFSRPIGEVDGAQFFDQGSPNGPLMDPFDDLLKMNSKDVSFQDQINDARSKASSLSDKAEHCNKETKTYSSEFMMKIQCEDPCRPCHPDIEAEHPTLLEFLGDKRMRDLSVYIDSLERTKGLTHYQPPQYLRRKQPTSKERRDELYKTELCNAWVNGKKCRFQDRCIFAHGSEELRNAPRKQERNRFRPPVQKHITSLLNKITEDNFGTITTEFLSTCVEGINDEKMANHVVRALFTKACIENSFRHIYASIWRKLLNIHPLYQVFERQMFELCLCEYGKPRNKLFGLGCMCWIAELVSHNEFNQEIVHRILGDMYHNQQNEMNVELWCKLIEQLAGSIDSSKYFDCLSQMKEKAGTRIRFMIMNLEDLRGRSWMPR